MPHTTDPAAILKKSGSFYKKEQKDGGEKHKQKNESGYPGG